MPQVKTERGKWTTAYMYATQPHMHTYHETMTLDDSVITAIVEYNIDSVSNNSDGIYI